MSAASRTAPLVGREYEMRLLSGLVERVRDGGGAVVVRGEAGIGKSALLAEVSRLAAGGGWRVLRTAGVESEAEVAFAGLYPLLRPFLGQVEQLPSPQRGALLTALGRTDAVAPDLFLTALATLNLLGEAATRVPILLIVEDGTYACWATRSMVTAVAATTSARRW